MFYNKNIRQTQTACKGAGKTKAHKGGPSPQGRRLSTLTIEYTYYIIYIVIMDGVGDIYIIIITYNQQKRVIYQFSNIIGWMFTNSKNIKIKAMITRYKYAN